MKKFILLCFILLFCWTSCQKKGVERWKSGSSNTIFKDVTELDLEMFKVSELDYLEIGWQNGTKNTPKEVETWAQELKKRIDNAGTKKWSLQLPFVEGYNISLNKVGIKVWSVHLPYGEGYDISQPDEAIRSKAVAQNIADIEMIGRTLAPEKIIIHASFEPISDSIRSQYLDAAKKSLAEIAPKAKAIGAKLLVENLPRTCIGNTSKELTSLIDGIDNIAICFDTNHLLQESHADFIKNTAGKIESTHMSDYDGIDEKHWMPKQGIINWADLLHGLSVNGYNGPFIYEVGQNMKGTRSIIDLSYMWIVLKQDYHDKYIAE